MWTKVGLVGEQGKFYIDPLRRPPSEAPRQLEVGAWLQGGESYIQVVTPLIVGASPISIQLSFRTFALEGVLLALYSDDMAQVRWS